MTSWLEFDNLFLNREWFFRIVHNQGFIKTRRPPGVRCSDGKRGRSYRLQRYKIFYMFFMLMKFFIKKETQSPPRLCIFPRRLEALVGNASKRCIVCDASKRCFVCDASKRCIVRDAWKRQLLDARKRRLLPARRLYRMNAITSPLFTFWPCSATDSSSLPSKRLSTGSMP